MRVNMLIKRGGRIIYQKQDIYGIDNNLKIIIPKEKIKSEDKIKIVIRDIRIMEMSGSSHSHSTIKSPKDELNFMIR